MIRNLIIIIANCGARLLGRKNLYRFGRWAYMTARNDVPNRIGQNGEEWVQSCVLDACCGSMNRVIVFDVGANIGDWLQSLLSIAERQGFLKQLDIHAFEPVQTTYERLVKAIMKDSRTNTASVKTQCLAMSSSKGNASMFIVGDCIGTNSLHRDPTETYTQSLTVVINTIDNYLEENNIEVVHLLKCDAEGHDLEVLLGAQKALQHERIRVLQFEYNHRWIYSRHYLKDAFDLIVGLPYVIGKVTPGVIEFYSEWHPELEKHFEANYVIVHYDARKWFIHQNKTFDASNAICNAGDFSR